MNGDKLLLDTNTVLGYLRGADAVVSFIEERPSSQSFISVITRMELLSFHGMDTEEESVINGFLDDVTVVPLNDEVESTAIALRRVTRRKLPDAIVAATAVYLDALLVTGDGPLAGTLYAGLRTVEINTVPDS